VVEVADLDFPACRDHVAFIDAQSYASGEKDSNHAGKNDQGDHCIRWRQSGKWVSHGRFHSQQRTAMRFLLEIFAFWSNRRASA
jgi:hypothetical protein